MFIKNLQVFNPKFGFQNVIWFSLRAQFWKYWPNLLTHLGDIKRDNNMLKISRNQHKLIIWSLLLLVVWRSSLLLLIILHWVYSDVLIVLSLGNCNIHLLLLLMAVIEWNLLIYILLFLYIKDIHIWVLVVYHLWLLTSLLIYCHFSFWFVF